MQVGCVSMSHLSRASGLHGRVNRSARWAGSYGMLFSMYFLLPSFCGLAFKSRTCCADSTLKHLGTCNPIWTQPNISSCTVELRALRYADSSAVRMSVQNECARTLLQGQERP